jgi:acyl-homoserine lactone acylase PvdQ
MSPPATRFAVMLVALGLPLTVLAQSEEASTAVRELSWAVAGLDSPADIVIDHWGIAHIFADP